MTETHDFASLAPYFGPGQLSLPPEIPDYLTHPRKYNLGGLYYEFFSVRHLAAAVNRSTQTVRAWEDKGIIPIPLRNEDVKDRQMRHRLYTRPQVAGIRKIAIEEGILDRSVKIGDTKFRESVIALFAEIIKLPYSGAVQTTPPRFRALRSV